MTGESLEQAIKQIREACTTFWEDGHQRCETSSVTGHYCKYKISESEHEHDSGYRYTSSCNCGKKQLIRNDPFTLKVTFVVVCKNNKNKFLGSKL